MESNEHDKPNDSARYYVYTYIKTTFRLTHAVIRILHHQRLDTVRLFAGRFTSILQVAAARKYRHSPEQLRILMTW